MAKTKKRKLEGVSPAKRDTGRPQKSAKTSQKAAQHQRQLEPVIPFDPEERLLLVGEGDFSFAKSIVEHHGCCDVTATCFDSRAELLEKYNPQAEEHISYLEDEGQTVLYAVDATKLDSTKALKRPFERIVFNFPHVGGKTKDVNRQVRFNQELLVKFFAAAKVILDAGGTIIVTLFEGEPYTLWNVRDVSRIQGRLVRCCKGSLSKLKLLQRRLLSSTALTLANMMSAARQALRARSGQELQIRQRGIPRICACEDAGQYRGRRRMERGGERGEKLRLSCERGGWCSWTATEEEAEGQRQRRLR